jgi:hypothetical protein
MCIVEVLTQVAIQQVYQNAVILVITQHSNTMLPEVRKVYSGGIFSFKKECRWLLTFRWMPAVVPSLKHGYLPALHSKYNDTKFRFMKIKKTLWIVAVILSCNSFTAKGQDLMNMEDSIQKSIQPSGGVIASTWKDTRLINAQTTKTADPNVMVFRIMHRFGDMGTSGGGFPTLYGFDVASDIYFSFEFGITNNLELGFGRSEMQQLIDVMGKYRLFTQKANGMPVSLAFYEDAGVTPESSFKLYADAVSPSQHFADRLSYFSQLILDRRFNNRISAELLTGFSYRNYVLASVNPNNGATDQNSIPFVGAGGRITLTKHSAIVFDYYYMLSAYRTNNNDPPFSNALSVGYEVETGGHVFEINISNASYINENNIIPYTNDSWSTGAIKLGFSISRAFSL